MISKPDTVADCDAQLKVLYISLGKHLYENIDNGRIRFAFQSSDERLAKKAGELLDRIREASPAQEPSGAPEPEAQAEQPAVRHPSAETRDHRGSLERYTELMIELFDIKKKLSALKTDIEEYISLATLHLWESESGGIDEAVRDLRIVEENIISLIATNMEAVQDLMTRKKDSANKDHAGEYADPETLNGEIEFFNRAAADIRHTSHQVEALVKNAVNLFEEIKRIYEEGIAADLQLKKDFGLLEDSGTPQAAIETAASEADEAPMSDLPSAAALAVEEFPDPQEESLLETAARRLSLETVALEEKAQILNTVFRSVPARAVSFLSNILKSMDMPMKKGLVDMLIKMDNPMLVDIYKDFLNSEDALLRMHGIMGLRRIGSEDARSAIISAVDDRDANIRRLVVNCLESTGTNSEMSTIMRMAGDPDETVARVAIRKLGMMQNRVSFTQILPKLDSPNEKIRKEAIGALKTMTGTDLGYKYFASDADRKKSVKSWQKLWNDNQSNPHFLQDIKISSRNKPQAKSASPVKRPAAVRPKPGAKSR